MSPRADSRSALSRLLLIDRLEVGPVRVTPRSLSSVYRVVRGSATAETELRYTYEQDVFEPHDPASLNLASLVAAQVALNYGLFCGEIAFHGPLDRADRRFLSDMAANTAREIYVHKILRPNPFLVPEVRDLPPVRRDSYLQAKLVFPDARSLKEHAEPWTTTHTRVAVLSSGGKESLLSYGLLREAGLETHAVFVNESGRHWYTAVNGYRYLDEVHPETTVRVWTSADRVFSWMLRQLPIVRPDFHRLRADDYPIRLWTVAVFLFGALPVLRARGIGRLVIGDEHDTTRRRTTRGIPHYDGLYDQSRFFDNALSRYYRRKRWNVSQFSILRPLSELLVQKTLYERYPDLQRNQVSCHATHVREERVKPCGKCEKCRRVVAMQAAIGGDPTASGYTPNQVEACLEALATKELHQEEAGAEHVLWLLRRAGRLPDADATGKAEPHPEVMRLRFDETRSPPDAVPRDLREPVLRVLLSHAEGAVRRSGRQWISFDPLTDPGIHRPYRYESPEPRPPVAEPAGVSAAPSGALRGRDWMLGELSWPEAERRFREVDIALLPVGSIEQHGPHLPLDTDAWDAAHLCEEVARRCSEPRPIVLPLIPYGVSYHHQEFPGTLSVSPETLARLVYEIGISASRYGIAKLVIVNGHGGNIPTLQFAAQMINRDAHIFTCVDSGETSDADVFGLTETPADVHAGEIETSTTLATRPHLVDMERAQPFVPRFSSRYLDFSSEYGVEWYAHTEHLSPSGVLGDPTRASAVKGERIWEVVIAHLTTFVENLKGMTLAEIHERRS